MRLNLIAMGGTLGIMAGVGMMILAWTAWVWGYNTTLVQGLAVFYPGYDASLSGGFFGLGWGLLVGVTTGILLAWLYNCLSPCCVCCTVEKPTSSMQDTAK
jgi:hypothetical protein